MIKSYQVTFSLMFQTIERHTSLRLTHTCRSRQIGMLPPMASCRWRQRSRADTAGKSSRTNAT